ncbi:MAG TPA: conjugal transfer protein MobC [Puia sp.]|nr:conjugal transfer protein MobC [Puia sp.]
MTINTGENDQGLRKIMDMTRAMSILLLCLHFYYYCHSAFKLWNLTTSVGDRVLFNVEGTRLFAGFNKAKLLAIIMLSLSLIGAKGKKDEKLGYQTAGIYVYAGLLLYFSSWGLLFLDIPVAQRTILYIAITVTGYLLFLKGGALLSRIIKLKQNSNVFNTENETFPQEERLIENEYSINLSAIYRLRNEVRNSWINFINPRRGLLILGSPGSGKSYFIIENIIRQQIKKGFAQFIYDFKYPDLSTIAYNYFLRYKNVYPVCPSFYAVNFSDPEYSHRCNPLNPALMNEILDAMEASKTMLLSINRTWANKQGDFFVESPINFLAAVFWFLRKFKDGIYCTLPHAIELMQLDYEQLFTVLRTEPEIQTLVKPFISAYLENNMETVDSQMASVRIPLGRLASPQLYYILSGNDFSLDINNPQAPKIVCLGNDPVKSEALAPVISLICDRLNKIINQRGKAKCSTIYDEFGTIRVSSIQTIIATGRSNNIVPIITIQDYSQLKKVYSKEEAETIFNMTGNIISGQVSGETAESLSKRFPKIMQERESLSINSSDTSISKSQQLEISVPASTITSLSSGEFVGMVADNPDEVIEHKTFHAKILNDHPGLKLESDSFRPLPFIRRINPKDILNIYQKVKAEIQNIADNIMDEVLNDPGKVHLLVRK